MSCTKSGLSHDWTAYTSSKMSQAVDKLPDGYYILEDAAYPLRNHLLTPYRGQGLSLEKDSFDFHLC